MASKGQLCQNFAWFCFISLHWNVPGLLCCVLHFIWNRNNLWKLPFLRQSICTVGKKLLPTTVSQRRFPGQQRSFRNLCSIFWSAWQVRIEARGHTTSYRQAGTILRRTLSDVIMAVEWFRSSCPLHLHCSPQVETIELRIGRAVRGMCEILLVD